MFFSRDIFTVKSGKDFILRIPLNEEGDLEGEITFIDTFDIGMYKITNLDINQTGEFLQLSACTILIFHVLGLITDMNDHGSWSCSTFLKMAQYMLLRCGMMELIRFSCWSQSDYFDMVCDSH